MSKRIIVLNGIHGSGKTTQGKELARVLGCDFHPEVGAMLRQQTTEGTTESGEAFDQSVMQHEFARDELISSNPSMAVVETWHVGNLAYAFVRSPKVYSVYLSKLRQHLARFEVVPVLLTLSREVFKRRMSEPVRPQDLDDYCSFFERLFDHTKALYLELALVPIVLDSSWPISQVFDQLITELEKRGIST